MRRLLFVLLVFAACAGNAYAAPPTLVSVGHQSQHPTATWTLPPGVQAKVIEVATSTQTASDGYFFKENVKAFETLEPTQTSWLYGSRLDPGTYYVHVAGIDEPCFSASQCPVREFSQVLTLIIPAAATPADPATPATPAQPARKALALSAARLTGAYHVTLRTTASSNIDRKPGSKESGTWQLTPLCSSGPCAVRLHYHFGLLGSSSLTMRLVRSGSVYTGTGTAKLSKCSMTSVSGRLSVRVKVVKGAWIGKSWRATKITGTYRWEFPSATVGIFRCPAGWLNASMVGTLAL